LEATSVDSEHRGTSQEFSHSCRSTHRARA
jgi:hypothetical protein